MTAPPHPKTPSSSLPQGRFLYRFADEPRYGLYRYEDDPRLWITALGAYDRSRSAGPFEPHEAVRALRLANLEIPDGCELGPWQTGLGFFPRVALPEDWYEWTEVHPSRLEPSVTRYGRDDITGETLRICCAPPTYPPKVLWTDKKTKKAPPSVFAPERLMGISERVFARHPELRTARVGALKKAWNGHPEHSLLWAPTGALEGDFYIADVELTEPSDEEPESSPAEFDPFA